MPKQKPIGSEEERELYLFHNTPSLAPKKTATLVNILASRGVTDEGIRIATKVFESEPARRVRASSGAKNQSVRFTSRKMGCVIQAESISLEFANILLHEFSPEVTAFYDQPPSLDLKYRSNGRSIRTPYTPDCFVVSNDFIGFEEIKPLKKLEKISAKSPERASYCSKTNSFTSPAINKLLEHTGLSFRFRTELNFNKRTISNLAFLKGYLEFEPSSHTKPKWLKALFSKENSVRLIDALSQAPSADELYRCIVQGHCFFPITEHVLQDSADSHIYKNISAWEAQKRTLHTADSLECSIDDLPNTILTAPPKLLDTAAICISTLKKIQDKHLTVDEGASALNVSTRTVYRWLKQFKGTEEYSERLSIVIGNKADRGNRTPRLPIEITNKLDELIQDHYLSNRSTNPHKIYNSLYVWCEKEQLTPPSKSTVYKRFWSIDDESSSLARLGAKASYQYSAYDLEPSDSFTFTAQYFMQRCHIDHTKVDIEIFIPKQGISERPYLTIIRDEYSGMILSFYISFQPPSYISVMMAMKFMIIDHHKKPEYLILDGGKEFQSNSFETFCATAAISIISREGQPRAGGDVERFFGTLNSFLFDNLDGRTRHMKNVRQVSNSHLPEKHAKWTLSQLATLINTAISTYNLNFPAKGNRTPTQAREYSISTHGNRDYLNQKMTEVLLLAALPLAPKQPRLKRNKTIRFQNCDYWHKSFTQAPKKSIKVPLKWDPEDYKHIYIYYPDRWIKCSIRNRNHLALSNASKQAKSEEIKLSAAASRKAANQSYPKISQAIDQAENLLEQEISATNEVTPPTDKEANQNTSFKDVFSLDIPSSEDK